MRLVGILLATSLALAGQAAFAQDYARPGLYAAVNGVTGFDNFDLGPGIDFDSSIGISGRIGNRFTPNFAIEGQLEYAGEFDLDGFGSLDVSATLLSGNGKFYFLTEQIQPYVLGGLGWGFMDLDTPGFGSADDDGFVLRLGGGVDFYINENIGLLLEGAYNVATGDLEDLSYATLGWGLFYRW